MYKITIAYPCYWKCDLEIVLISDYTYYFLSLFSVRIWCLQAERQSPRLEGKTSAMFKNIDELDGIGFSSKPKKNIPVASDPIHKSKRRAIYNLLLSG